jgi:hypothetical protein
MFAVIVTVDLQAPFGSKYVGIYVHGLTLYIISHTQHKWLIRYYH